MTDVDPITAPQQQFLEPELVLVEMAEVGAKRVREMSVPKVIGLSMIAGAFITAGALFSTLIAAGTEVEGVRRMLEGFGFSVGFFLVILSGALLFTEANVEMPATLLGNDYGGFARCLVRLWLIAPFGNLAGALIVGLLVNYTHEYSEGYREVLSEVIALKISFADIGGIRGWTGAVVSGMLANWLVGMAAFLATMGRTIIGKYIPVLLTVMAFVAAGFLHSPANMAYFSLAEPIGLGPGWGSALWWSILPAAIGNVVGAFLFVALPFWLVGTRRGARLSAR